jgi:hypothetical protein
MKRELNSIKKDVEGFPASLEDFNRLVYQPCGFNLISFRLNKESAEYDACSFNLNGKQIQYRMSKITPSKAGQFVTIWKRNKDCQTAPFDVSDNIHFIVVTSVKGSSRGQFIFPASMMIEKGIFSQNKKQGKRGIRVYPPWDKTENNQARKTQAWQIKYFLSLNAENSTKKDLAKELFANH